MSGGLFSLLDDIATLAKLAAASIDDIGAAAGRASVKAAGVVIDDTAVTPAYVHGLAANRELPIIRKIATGSLKNKLVFILPAAMLLSAIAPVLVEIILMLGGAYLCFEGAEKVHHRFAGHDQHDDQILESGQVDSNFDSENTIVLGPEAEAKTISGAIRTDFILSAEIMVIALKEVIDNGFVSRAIILAVVALVITAVVYGFVALIVKMDDIGLRMAETSNVLFQRIGRALVLGMPKLLTLMSVVGTAAMIWVGGHILLVGADELGWHWPYKQVHAVENFVHEVAGIGGFLAWFANTLMSAIVGLCVGFAIIAIIARLPFAKKSKVASH